MDVFSSVVPKSMTVAEWNDVKDCLKHISSVNWKQWTSACYYVKPFGSYNSPRETPVDLDILLLLVKAYYDRCWDLDLSDKDSGLLHPLETQHWLRDPDEWGICVEEQNELRDFAHKCLQINRFCMYYFSWLGNDVHAASVVLELDVTDEPIRFFDFVPNVWFESVFGDLAGADDDEGNPLLLFSTLGDNKEFVHSLLESKPDIFGTILEYVAMNGSLLDQSLLDKWHDIQVAKLKWSDESFEDTKIVEETYRKFSKMLQNGVRT